MTHQAYGAIYYFYDYMEKHNIDLVCVWNGTLIPLAAATTVARKTGRKTLFFENGYLPGTTTVDPCGVNYKNSLVGKTRLFYDAVQVDPDKLAQLYEQEQRVRALKQKWYHRLLKRQPQGSPEPVKLPQRYIFLPFQVHDDTQVLMHSPTIKTMFQLVDYVIPAVLRHNEKTGDNLWVIAKEHPSDFGRIDYGEIKEKYQGFPVIFLRYYPTPALIKGAKGIITLNSSVGIEALLQHKPVITLGNAFYNVPGLVKHVAPPEDLADVLGFVDCPPNDNLIDKFLYYLRYHYLADGSWRSPDERHFRSVEAKIRAVIENR
ncbi:hypothetical protein [Sporolituus thermophilus]|uniref:capsular polysaccharide export protein, LipB/KpsS family n=1 Tax=Sporolituus thermophilus TaxID=608505 RepID=UPI0011600234|nr:hypothetical protein [Sporolituus thermophilus]